MRQKRLNKKNIEKLLRLYNFKCSSFFRIKSGIENASFIISSEKEKYVLRIYREDKNLKSIKEELEYMMFLRRRNFPVPKLIVNSQGEVLSRMILDKKYINYILMEYIDGNHLQPDQLSLISVLARLQANIHKNSLVYKKKYSKTDIIKRKLFINISEYKNIKLALSRKKDGHNIIKIVDEVISEVKGNLASLVKLPSAPVHLDFHGSNILVKNDQIKGVIDFDDLAFCPLIFDLANSLLWWSYMNRRSEAKKIKERYLSEYQKFRRLSRLEIKFVSLLMRWRNISVRLNPKRSVGYKEWCEAAEFDNFLRNN